MYGYAADSAAATRLTPFTVAQVDHQSRRCGSSQNAAVAHTAGTAAGSHAQTASSSMSQVSQTLQGLSWRTTASGSSHDTG